MQAETIPTVTRFPFTTITPRTDSTPRPRKRLSRSSIATSAIRCERFTRRSPPVARASRHRPSPRFWHTAQARQSVTPPALRFPPPRPRRFPVTRFPEVRRIRVRDRQGGRACGGIYGETSESPRRPLMPRASTSSTIFRRIPTTWRFKRRASSRWNVTWRCAAPSQSPWTSRLSSRAPQAPSMSSAMPRIFWSATRARTPTSTRA